MDETTSVEQRSVTQKIPNESRRNPTGSKAGNEGRRSYNLTMENNAPLLLPSGLNSMLKNTTETGDIGIFSIKPSRLPRHPAITRAAGRARSNGSNYHRRPETQLPYHGPRVFSLPSTIDDRTRLSSYGRDAMSEVASLYESSSQKSSESSKILEDQDRRSYSMTVSSFSGYRLANPHSSTSLSSQIDQSEAQRPRSSFQYPARLRRPGFRPSSPALTDGGVVDYSRRVEIQREANSPNCQNVSLRPLSLRSDVNRSTPTASGQSPTEHGFKRMPVIQQDDAPGESSNHVDTPESPPKANLSVTSCNNYHIPNRTAAPVPVQNKARHTSPLYYDYTENFLNEAREGDHAAEELEDISPPPFLLEKTIHEDRELSSDWSYLAMTDLQGRGFLANEQVLLPHEDPKKVTGQPADISYVGGGGMLPSQDDSESVQENSKHHRYPESTKPPTLEHNVRSTRSNQSLPPNIESSCSTEISKLRNPRGHTEPGSQHIEVVDETAMGSESSYAASLRLQELFSPPSGLNSTFVDSSFPIITQGAAIHDIKRKPLSREVSETDKTDSDGRSRNMLDLAMPTQAPQCLETTAMAPVLQRPISAQNKRDKSSPYFRARPSSTSSTQADMIPEVATQPQDLTFDAPSQNYAGSSGANYSSSMPLRRYKHSFKHSWAKFPARNYKSDGSLPDPRNKSTFIQAAGKMNQHENPGTCDKSPSVEGRDDFSQAAVVSPTPIHPGQQFLTLPTAADSEPQSNIPVLLEASGETPSGLLQREPSVEPAAQHFFSKFRLKPRPYTVRTKPYPPVTRRRNLDGSYPLDDRRRDVQLLPTKSLRKPINLTPKLKLKISRASVSSLGTVRINREAAVQAELGDSEILSPEDLFTPPPRLASLFRQVSRHFRPKDEYEEIKVPETTDVGGQGGTELAVISNNSEQASGVGAIMNGPYPQIHPKSSVFVDTPPSPYPLISRESSQGGMSLATSQNARQLPHHTALMPAVVQPGETQSCFGDYGSQLEESSHLQGNIPSLQAEQPIHHSGTGAKQAPTHAPWRTGDVWDQFQAPDFLEMDDESDLDPTGPSRKLNTTFNEWLEDVKAKMFGCGRSRR
ncbi:hypothetical protein V498_09351 [Pseudogymnoascus sp. VKM F-4517 (FW-2822)]|nr:hypothetical protein V498_09351 [Pseudogymnoascus sp. VKM F-4517 (FW-2822)]